MVNTKARADVTSASIEAAIKRGETFDRYAPRATRAIYRKDDDAIAITLSTGVQIAIPRRLLQGVRDASAREAAQIKILGPGSTLEWSALDVHHGLGSLLKGVFGNPGWMREIGKRGGSARSLAKARAARKNGRKGGRPSKAVA